MRTLRTITIAAGGDGSPPRGAGERRAVHNRGRVLPLRRGGGCAPLSIARSPPLVTAPSFRGFLFRILHFPPFVQRVEQLFILVGLRPIRENPPTVVQECRQQLVRIHIYWGLGFTRHPTIALPQGGEIQVLNGQGVAHNLQGLHRKMGRG